MPSDEQLMMPFCNAIQRAKYSSLEREATKLFGKWLLASGAFIFPQALM
jgi:hypothetical protein